MCKNLCVREGIKASNISLYGYGMKFCTKCQIFVRSAGDSHCFCCGTVLRQKAKRAGSERKATRKTE